MTNIPIFIYHEKFEIARRGTIYSGPCPFSDLVDRNISPIGRILIVDGMLKKIQGMETFMKLPGPKLGEGVGILFEDV